MKNQLLIIIGFMLFITNQSFAQKEMSRSLGQTKTIRTKEVKFGAFGEIIEIKNDKLENKLYFHAAKEITKETGFYIQLISSQEILEKDNALFQNFGNVLVEKTLNPKYCYIVGGFETKSAAKIFMDNIIIERYPNAKLIEFKNGERK
jgi:hypothetical protein